MSFQVQDGAALPSGSRPSRNFSWFPARAMNSLKCPTAGSRSARAVACSSAPASLQPLQKLGGGARVVKGDVRGGVAGRQHTDLLIQCSTVASCPRGKPVAASVPMSMLCGSVNRFTVPRGP